MFGGKKNAHAVSKGEEKVQMCRRNKLANKCEMCIEASCWRQSEYCMGSVREMGYSARRKFACLGGAFSGGSSL